MSAPDRSLAAAVIGLGSMGVNHVRVYNEIEGVELVAVADVALERLEMVRRGGGPRVYEDYGRLLAEERLDVVSVCVPTRLHLEVALAVIAKGVALLVEKPIAATLDEGREMARAAREAGVPLMVGHVERFNPAVLEVKRRLQAGELGRVFQVFARRTGPFPKRVRDVGVVHDLAPHDIDIMRFLLESEVERVYAETEQRISTEHEDMLSGLLRFRNGAVGVLDVNWLTPIKVRQLSVLGERGLLLVDYLGEEVCFYRKAPPETAGADAAPGSAPQPLRFERGEPLRLELESFVTAVRRGEEPPVSAEEGLAALEVASLLVESARGGRVMSIGETP
ncbi:MAG: Gfo/Idh/MocA family oxidoreductase [Dehalococcoidia bacterium]